VVGQGQITVMAKPGRVAPGLLVFTQIFRWSIGWRNYEFQDQPRQHGVGE
jgi:hypothetical protein